MTLRPASQITDRAKRYRAHAPGVRPGPPKQCGYCGSKRNCVPDHIDGNEGNLKPENLMWLCKACNTSKGFLLKKHGIGKLTAQYNPSKSSRAAQMQDYANAIKVMRGQFDGDVAAAVRTIRATPPDIRSAYTAKTWPSRRHLYGPTGRGNPMQNPAVSRAQYGLAQAVLSGRARLRSMSASAAREIIHRSPAKFRNEYARNPGAFLSHALGGSVLSASSREADRLTRKILRRNSAEGAERAYKEFHGHPADTDTIVEEEIHEHTNVAGIGDLCWIEIRCEDEDGEEYDVRLDGFNGALLSMGEKMEVRPQLFIEGGNQSVDLKQFGISAPLHELETLGRMVCVAYQTDKHHLGSEGGEAEYVHAIEMPLDEEEAEDWGLDEIAESLGISLSEYLDELEDELAPNIGPDVIFDTPNRHLLLSGGSYTLKPEGIDN